MTASLSPELVTGVLKNHPHLSKARFCRPGSETGKSLLELALP